MTTVGAIDQQASSPQAAPGGTGAAANPGQQAQKNPADAAQAASPPAAGPTPGQPNQNPATPAGPPHPANPLDEFGKRVGDMGRQLGEGFQKNALPLLLMLGPMLGPLLSGLLGSLGGAGKGGGNGGQPSNAGATAPQQAQAPQQAAPMAAVPGRSLPVGQQQAGGIPQSGVQPNYFNRTTNTDDGTKPPPSGGNAPTLPAKPTADVDAQDALNAIIELRDLLPDKDFDPGQWKNKVWLFTPSTDALQHTPDIINHPKLKATDVAKTFQALNHSESQLETDAFDKLKANGEVVNKVAKAALDAKSVRGDLEKMVSDLHDTIGATGASRLPKDRLNHTATELLRHAITKVIDLIKVLDADATEIRGMTATTNPAAATQAPSAAPAPASPNAVVPAVAAASPTPPGVTAETHNKYAERMRDMNQEETDPVRRRLDNSAAFQNALGNMPDKDYQAMRKLVLIGLGSTPENQVENLVHHVAANAYPLPEQSFLDNFSSRQYLNNREARAYGNQTILEARIANEAGMNWPSRLGTKVQNIYNSHAPENSKNGPPSDDYALEIGREVPIELRDSNNNVTTTTFGQVGDSKWLVLERGLW